MSTREWNIIPMYDERGEADPIAVVEAPGKKAALSAAAKGLGGEVTTVGSWQSWHYALMLHYRAYTATPRKRRDHDAA